MNGLLALWMLAGSASAQVPITFAEETVMVVPIQATEPQLKGTATGLDTLLGGAVGQTHTLTDISVVPDFEEQGYDARTYMDACPPGKYSGCMLVVAQRVEMDWAIGGTLEPADVGEFGTMQLTIHIVDVKGSREVMAFGVVVSGEETDAGVIAGVSGVFDNLLDGLADEIDVRGDTDDPAAQEAFEKRRQDLIAASLASLENQLGEVIREDIAMGRLDPPKLTRRDLADYANRDDQPPWERLGMTQSQYIRFENSDVTLLAWRRRIRGRFGQLLLRASVGGGPGPWGLHHEGKWLRSFDTASNQFVDSAVRQYQEVRRASATDIQFELGFGVAPWIEVAGVVGLQNARYTFRFDQDVSGDPVNLPGDLNQTTGQAVSYGGRVQFVPMPTYPVRPTAHMGVFTWDGGSLVPDQEQLNELPGPVASYAQFGAGAEASAGRFLNVFLRGHVNTFLSGQDTWFSERQDGNVAEITEFEEPIGSAGPSFGIQGGVQLRISLLPDPDDKARLGTLDDEEPDL